MQQLALLYQQWCGQEPATIERLPGAGSNRSYYRLSADGGSPATVIGCINDVGEVHPGGPPEGT